MTPLRPADPSRRLGSLDALRGIALCGILLINIFDMGGPVAMDRPMAAPSWSDPDWHVWTIAQLFVSGTMRGLFSMLFGIGLLLFIGNDESADRVGLYVRRLILLLLFGIVDGTLLLWPGDILTTYAAAGLVVLVLHPLRAGRLLSAAAVILLLLSVWDAIEASGISPADTVYSAELLAHERAARLGSYRQAFDYMSLVTWTWTMDAASIRWVGDAAAFMLVGMALYRKRLFNPASEAALARALLRYGYAVGLGLRAVHTALILANDGAPTAMSALLDQPGRLAMTLGHVGLFLLLWRGGRSRVLMARFAAMGRMALTLYLGQSVAAALIFSGFGLGLWNRLGWPQLWLVAIAILIMQAIFAALWFKAFRYGPIEWLWRWGTYGTRP